jgi:hypothetical protein
MIWVTKAALQGGYNVAIEFNDGLKGVIDFKPVFEQEKIEPIRELLDLKKFQTMTTDTYTLCWDNEVDLAPEYLYDILKEQMKFNKNK